MTESTSLKTFKVTLNAINGKYFEFIETGSDKLSVKRALLKRFNEDKFIEFNEQLINVNNILNISIDEKKEEPYTEPEDGQPW
ncbi:hypothetical protein GM610_26700 (plasmid) [Bacillus tropicus]|uniref:hypothetical protein n=1 Tax=Bacillus tropicus TaxID=2026188 RepID=UPI0013E0CFE9|nr:hypothetical protein [Bacillus tropicus]QIE40435.1 hypothetical protein GM610_26700 [Bacillus tropicus]